MRIAATDSGYNAGVHDGVAHFICSVSFFTIITNSNMGLYSLQTLSLLLYQVQMNLNSELDPTKSK